MGSLYGAEQIKCDAPKASKFCSVNNGYATNPFNTVQETSEILSERQAKKIYITIVILWLYWRVKRSDTKQLCSIVVFISSRITYHPSSTMYPLSARAYISLFNINFWRDYNGNNFRLWDSLCSIQSLGCLFWLYGFTYTNRARIISIRSTLE